MVGFDTAGSAFGDEERGDHAADDVLAAQMAAEGKAGPALSPFPASPAMTQRAAPKQYSRMTVGTIARTTGCRVANIAGISICRPRFRPRITRLGVSVRSEESLPSCRRANTIFA